MKLDYENDFEQLPHVDQLISRASNSTKDWVDKEHNLTFVALNSSFIFYTKLMFIKYDESQVALQIDLYSLIGTHEQPPTNTETGKAELIVEDAQWTPDNQFVLILLRGASSSHRNLDHKAYRPGTLCILPRLGVQFTRIFNPTRFNLHP